MLSATDSGKISGGCNTIAIWLRSEFSVYSRMSTPSIVTVPLVGSKNRGNRPSNVDLPAPVGPTIAIFEPAATVKSISFSTGVSGR